MTLSAQQRAYFTRFGFLIVRRLFTPSEMLTITSGFERTLAQCGPRRQSEKFRNCVLGPIQHLPEMNALLDHPGILELAGGILGEDFNYACGDGNTYNGDTNWHPDGSWGQLFACKIAIYLDPLTRTSGSLRVIPGSHDPQHPIRRHQVNVASPMEEFGVGGADIPGAEALETMPGDVVIFNHDTYHASFGGGARRRMFTMNLTKHCDSPEDHERLRQYLSRHSPGGYKLPIGGMYFNPIIETASPGRMRHLEQCRAVHDEIFPQLKAVMTHQQQVEGMLRTLHPESVQEPALSGA
jgi:hypothetical protein